MILDVPLISWICTKNPFTKNKFLQFPLEKNWENNPYRMKEYSQ